MHKAIDVALNLVLCLLGLLVVFAVVPPFVIYWMAQPHQREIQQKVLEFNLSKVSASGGKVSLVARRSLLRTANGDFLMRKPMLFSIGSQFKASDRHWGATYTISSIDSDGITITYNAAGGPPSSVRSSSGTIKLLYK
ncbi:hypothetical protein IAD21_04285 [Abditibacteriota bacterium]|nr:hypothetical protein IAD21_04285 [Abditibacteriota bacterium]